MRAVVVVRPAAPRSGPNEPVDGLQEQRVQRDLLLHNPAAPLSATWSPTRTSASRQAPYRQACHCSYFVIKFDVAHKDFHRTGEGQASWAEVRDGSPPAGGIPVSPTSNTPPRTRTAGRPAVVTATPVAARAIRSSSGPGGASPPQSPAGTSGRLLRAAPIRKAPGSIPRYAARTGALRLALLCRH